MGNFPSESFKKQRTICAKFSPAAGKKKYILISKFG